MVNTWWKKSFLSQSVTAVLNSGCTVFLSTATDDARPGCDLRVGTW